jgi:hypothetical protein
MVAKRFRKTVRCLGLSALLVSTLTLADVADVQADKPHNRDEVDVACDANSIRFGEPKGPNPADPTGDPGPHPYYGSPFVVKGVIYPKGTLAANCDPAVSPCGLLPDGQPEFPDKVIGTWYCRGWFVGEGGDGDVGGIFTPSGPFVATTQIYDLNLQHPGTKMLISDGIELIDLLTPFQRAITGGTGPFKDARGQVTQTALGKNATGLFNFHFQFDLHPDRNLYE